MDPTSLCNLMKSSNTIEKEMLLNPSIRNNIVHYESKKTTLDQKLFEYLLKNFPYLKKLIIGEITIQNPWSELSKFPKLKTIGFDLREKDYFPRNQLNIRKLELTAYTPNTKQYIDTLSNFYHLTELKLEKVKITINLLNTLNKYLIIELHIVDCLEKFQVEEAPNIFETLKKLSTVNNRSMKPTKIFLLYCHHYSDEDLSNVRTLNISYSGEDNAFHPTYSSTKLKNINIYINCEAYYHSLSLIRFISSIEPHIKVQIKISKQVHYSKKLTELANEANKIRKFLENVQNRFVNMIRNFQAQ